MRSGLCDYSAIMLNKNAKNAKNATHNNANKNIIFKRFVTFTNCIRGINNTQVDDAYDIDVVMPMYNLIEYSNNYLKTSGIL